MVTVIIVLFRLIKYSVSVSKIDVVLIVKDPAPFSLVPFLKLFKRMGKFIIIDFDDAIFLKQKRIAKYVGIADSVVVGNRTLASWAQRINSQTAVVPTVLDLKKYPNTRTYPDREALIVIGWIGSMSTARYLESLRAVFKKISELYQVEFRIIGGEMQTIPGVMVKIIDWSEESEERELYHFDIGIAPLPDDEWARGKCGFKLLQYMAAGIPAIASPVGVNSEIIEHGRNGYLAKTEEEWIRYLSLLINNVKLRKEIGQNARRAVERKYSLEGASGQLASIIKSTTRKINHCSGRDK